MLKPGLTKIEGDVEIKLPKGTRLTLAPCSLASPTHHVHIPEMNTEGYRLKQSRSRPRPPSQ